MVVEVKLDEIDVVEGPLVVLVVVVSKDFEEELVLLEALVVFTYGTVAVVVLADRMPLLVRTGPCDVFVDDAVNELVAIDDVFVDKVDEAVVEPAGVVFVVTVVVVGKDVVDDVRVTMLVVDCVVLAGDLVVDEPLMVEGSEVGLVVGELINNWLFGVLLVT